MLPSSGLYPVDGMLGGWTRMQIYTLCWNTQCAGLFSGRGATPRPSHSVFEDTDLHTVLGYAMCRAFLRSRCITLAEPSFTPIHTDKVGKSTRHGTTPTVRALFWMQNYNCVLGYAIAGLFSGQGATPWPSHRFT